MGTILIPRRIGNTKPKENGQTQLPYDEQKPEKGLGRKTVV